MSYLRKNSKSFLQRADSAAFWEAYVASKIAREGFNVTIMESHHGEYIKPEKLTSYDMEVHISPEMSLPIEVKSRKYLDMEVSKENIWVCNKKFFDRCWPGWDVIGRDFIFVNSRDSHMLWLPAGTPVGLGAEHDRSRNETFEVVTVPTNTLKPFRDFIAFLKGHV